MNFTSPFYAPPVVLTTVINDGSNSGSLACPLKDPLSSWLEVQSLQRHLLFKFWFSPPPSTPPAKNADINVADGCFCFFSFISKDRCQTLINFTWNNITRTHFLAFFVVFLSRFFVASQLPFCGYKSAPPKRTGKLTLRENKFECLLRESLAKCIPSCSFKYGLQDFIPLHQLIIKNLSFYENGDEGSGTRTMVIQGVFLDILESRVLVLMI